MSLRAKQKTVGRDPFFAARADVSVSGFFKSRPIIIESTEVFWRDTDVVLTQ